jgi:protein-disulfide isomerase
VVTVLSPFRAAFLALTLTTLSCHAQSPAASPSAVSPETARRVEVLIRSKSNIPPNYTISIADRKKSEIPGFDQISVLFTADGQTSKPATFLLSDDNKTLAQFSRYDISKDPKELVSGAGRPSRGGPVDAPVLIVGFDDLECPYCARMHAQLFPALVARYKDQVRIVYRDFPLDQHPWAMRAAVDANCVAAQSPTAYWNLVDYIHSHAPDLGGADHNLAKANENLDTLARDEAKKSNLKLTELNACIAKQDHTAIDESRKEAETLGVDSTPALFINGERLEGALPIEYVYRMVDNALLAEGKTPPPPVPLPPMPGASAPGN